MSIAHIIKRYTNARLLNYSTAVGAVKYIRWQWRNFFISYLCQLFPAILWGKPCEMFVILTSLS